jgi:hypothetical protein
MKIADLRPRILCRSSNHVAPHVKLVSLIRPRGGRSARIAGHNENKSKHITNTHLQMCDWSKFLGIAPCGSDPPVLVATTPKNENRVHPQVLLQFSKRGGSDPVVLVATRGEKCKLTSTILNVKANTPTNVFFYYYYYLCVDCCRFLCSDMQVALSEICAQLLC